VNKHLDRLSKYRVFDIDKKQDGTFEIVEGCDQNFSAYFTAEELRELAAEIIALSYY